ncbi:MAG: type VI secretion system tip protein VgrG [Gemmatimonadetes bacterium]|nr:type VI secretion system tip protein VgrG [Gemmatimonadota bacterium]
MAEYTQASRPLKVHTKLGEDVLLLSGFNGLEGISQPYSFQLELVSEDENIEAADLLRTEIMFEFPVAADDTRYVHGIVNRFAQLGKRDDLAFYRAEVVPWLWFLTLSRESRIYQELTAPDIIEQVFKRLGYSDFEFRLTRSYVKRTFCVQYRETHLNFVSRLLEEEGIFYYFEHSDSGHMLVLCDDSSNSNPVPGPEEIVFQPGQFTDEYTITQLEREHRVYAGKVALQDYDYEKPSTRLAGKQGQANEEMYDYPGNFKETDNGDERARVLLEAEEAQRQVVRGESRASGLIPGYHFKLTEHFQRSANIKYLVTQVQHLSHGGSFRGMADATPVEYSNDFLAIPHDTPYRPRRRTARPVIYGSQSALVVGKSGEEVWVDKLGRIKVHFYWDRDSQRDEKSSCWVRVAAPWAGKNWGAVSIPRMGNEVVVAFEEGDPDKPIVIGSVYNAEQMPPFGLPDAGIQMGMKTRSSKGGGGFNEVTMTDTKGKELLNIHAQYDMVTVVEHDMKETVVKGNRTLSIETGTNTTSVKGNDSHTVQAGDLTQDVTGNIKRKASADIDDKAAANVKITGDAGVSLTGTGSGVKIKGTGGDGIGLDGTPNVNAKGAAAVNIEAPTVDIGNVSIKIHGASIVLDGGGGKIEIGPAGVTVSGPLFKVDAGLAKIN